jgi:hypothetical protein
MRTIIGRLVVLTVALAVLLGSAAVGMARPKKVTHWECRCTCKGSKDGHIYSGGKWVFSTTGSASAQSPGVCEVRGLQESCTIDTPNGRIDGLYSECTGSKAASVRAPLPGSTAPLTPSPRATPTPKAPIGPPR